MIIWGKRKKIGQYTHLIYEVQENWENPNDKKKSRHTWKNQILVNEKYNLSMQAVHPLNIGSTSTNYWKYKVLK
jgi:hypothetical protein